MGHVALAIEGASFLWLLNSMPVANILQKFERGFVRGFPKTEGFGK